MKKIFLNSIIKLLTCILIAVLSSHIFKIHYEYYIFSILMATLVTSGHEFFKYKEILKIESDNAEKISNTTFNILKEEMTFLNNYTLMSESNNQLIFLSAPNIMLNSYFLVIKKNVLTTEESEIKIRIYPSLENPFSKKNRNF